MTLLVLGLVIFLGMHCFSMARASRAALIERVGEGRLQGDLFPALRGRHRPDRRRLRPVSRRRLYPGLGSAGLDRHLALLLVWIAFVCVAAAYLPGRIKARLKHPMLAGVKIWALAHLLANGDLGSILLFGSILAWAVVARISVKRRDVAAQHGGTAAPAGWRNDILAIVIGTAIYLAFVFWLHPWLIGVPVLPMRA